MEQKVYGIHMGPAKCAVDLGDGSERGGYVNQDYILQKLGRPHRAISLMYCYYPLDKGWPERASVAHASDLVSFAWDYPYDDYFTYKGGLGGDLSEEPFSYMRDVRRHGQDVLLTLTIDPHVTDEHLIAIAKDLTTFGRVQLRINHEATGSWFSFNKRCTYQEVADFYVRFHKIVKEHATNVQTILCIGGIEDVNATEMIKEEEFTEAVKTTDIWSVDKYITLHYGWPYDIAERGGKSHYCKTAEETYRLAKLSYDRFCYLNGGNSKPMVMSELNADGDVTGQIRQASMMKEFCNFIKEDKEQWLSGFTMYQFRDDGRLGLEMTDPNNKEVGIEQPLLQEYKEIIHDDFFQPVMTMKEEIKFPVTLRWGGSEDSDGITIPIVLEKNPVFFEVYFEEELKELNLMMCVENMWFYKAPGATCIDIMPIFWEKPLNSGKEVALTIFAPPADGENENTGAADWMINSYTILPKLPNIRVRYEPTEEC